MTVGRLDYNSEGLLLLTNDGGLARHMELPASGWIRRYRARAYGAIDMAAIEQIRKGVMIGEIQYEPAEVEIEKAGNGDNSWINWRQEYKSYRIGSSFGRPQDRK